MSPTTVLWMSARAKASSTQCQIGGIEGRFIFLHCILLRILNNKENEDEEENKNWKLTSR